jgi:hypothetical protein
MYVAEKLFVTKEDPWIASSPKPFPHAFYSMSAIEFRPNSSCNLD